MNDDFRMGRTAELQWSCGHGMEDRMEKSFRYPVPKNRKTRLEQCEERLEQVAMRTEQAKTRIEAAETRAEQAETRTESAKTRTEQAETRAEKAETRVEKAESMLDTLTGGQFVPIPPADSPADEADLRALGRLSTRQQEVLELIAVGENTKQIADTLKISSKTVEYHRKKLMESLVIHDVPGLVRFALRVGLIGLVPANG